MRLAIMQPYLFPYIGYFQLMSAVDRWVVYDDVAFIKGGWINRNNLRVNDARHLFTVPLSGASPHLPIAEVRVDRGQYGRWLERFRRTLEQSYGHAPRYPEVRRLVDEVLGEGADTIAELNLRALQAVHAHLGLATTLVPSSRVYGNDHLRGQERVLDICRIEGASTYVNAIGGRELYDEGTFAERGLTLRFLQTGDVRYAQGRGEFLPGLSILDVMMHVGPAELRELLARHTLVRGHAP